MERKVTDQTTYWPAYQEKQHSKRAMLRSAVDRLPLRRDMKEGIVELLRWLDHNSGDDGWCNAFNSTISAALDNLATRTLKRRLQTAREHGLLETKPSFDRKRGGQSSNANRVRWQQVKKLVRVEVSGTPQGRSGTPPGRSGTPYKRNIRCLVSGDQETPPPSFPVDTSAREWGEVVKLLRTVGLNEGDKAISLAKKGGLSPSYVIRLCEFFAEHRHGFQSPGALFYAIRVGTEGRTPAPDESFPPFTEEYKRSLRTRERLARPPALADELPEGPTLEEIYGDQLDAMTWEERDELAAMLNPMGQRNYRAARGAEKLIGLARYRLLDVMKTRDPSRAVLPALE